MKRIETYELTHLYKQLVELSKRDMTASGIKIVMNELNGKPLGEMDFVGELLPALIPVLLQSLDDTLTLRAARAREDLAKIEWALKQGSTPHA